MSPQAPAKFQFNPIRASKGHLDQRRDFRIGRKRVTILRRGKIAPRLPNECRQRRNQDAEIGPSMSSLPFDFNQLVCYKNERAGCWTHRGALCSNQPGEVEMADPAHLLQNCPSSIFLRRENRKAFTGIRDRAQILG